MDNNVACNVFAYIKIMHVITAALHYSHEFNIITKINEKQKKL